jgi:hypothetical protein
LVGVKGYGGEKRADTEGKRKAKRKVIGKALEKVGRQCHWLNCVNATLSTMVLEPFIMD